MQGQNPEMGGQTKEAKVREEESVCLYVSVCVRGRM